MGSFVISELPHPPKEKYSLAEPQHPPKVKYSLSTDTTELQGGKHDGNPHTTRHDPQDGLECRRQASCMGLLQGEVGAVLCDCWHSQRGQGDPYSLLWWQGGFRVMDSLEGQGGRGQRYRVQGLCQQL